MIIDQDKCTRCIQCMPYCPVGAIVVDKVNKNIVIDLDSCVECGTCLRVDICPEDALVQQSLTWPRTIRSALSNPLVVHRDTRIPGRGTEEMKTNDVTGRYGPGVVGMALEMGRPGTSTSFHDIQRVTQALAALDIDFELQNPLTMLMTDRDRGTFDPEILDERVLSAIIEFDIPLRGIPEVMAVIQQVAQEISTVFSLNICGLVERDGRQPSLGILMALGIQPSLNGKTNVGLGRPAFDFYAKRGEG
ncbi:MAG: 4Fe-4S binding protein [Chloroflexi bacterium]|nr:4Fe-4S binding protein [Chloroflexota bacterium]